MTDRFGEETILTAAASSSGRHLLRASLGASVLMLLAGCTLADAGGDLGGTEQASAVAPQVRPVAGADGAKDGPVAGSVRGTAPRDDVATPPIAGRMTRPEILNDLISEGLEENPEVKRAHAAWLAARKRILPARSLDDPTLTFSPYIRRVETRVGPQRYKLGIAQKLPFPGKLSLKGRMAEERAEEAKRQYEVIRLNVAARVKSIYYRLYLLDRSIEVTEANVELLRRFADIARTRYATGKASQQDVLKAEVRLSRLADELATFRQRRRAAEAAMNLLLDRAPETPIPKTENIEARSLRPVLDSLRRRAIARHPALAARKAGIRRARAAVALAEREFYPDLTVGLDYIDVGSGRTRSADDGKDAVALVFRLNVPLWIARRNAELDAARRSRAAAQASYDVARNDLLLDLETAFIEAQTAQHTVELYRTTILPQAEQTLEASLIGYQSDRNDFLDLLDSQRVLQDLQLEYQRADAAFEQQLAHLERAVGVEGELP